MKSAIILVAVAGFAGAVQADVIAEWDLLGAPGNQATQAPSASAANVSGLSIARGAGLTASSASNAFASAGWEGAAGSPALDSEYISFGFSVDPGFAVNLTSLAIGTRSSGTGPGTLGLFYNGDAFAAPLFTFVQDNTNFLNTIVDLSSLTGLTGNVEFRIIEIGNTQADGDGATTSSGTFRLTAYFENGAFSQNINFQGEVVPAPGALALLGLGGLVAGRRRR